MIVFVSQTCADQQCQRGVCVLAVDTIDRGPGQLLPCRTPRRPADTAPRSPMAALYGAARWRQCTDDSPRGDHGGLIVARIRTTGGQLAGPGRVQAYCAPLAGPLPPESADVLAVLGSSQNRAMIPTPQSGTACGTVSRARPSIDLAVWSAGFSARVSGRWVPGGVRRGPCGRVPSAPRRSRGMGCRRCSPRRAPGRRPSAPARIPG